MILHHLLAIEVLGANTNLFYLTSGLKNGKSENGIFETEISQILIIKTTSFLAKTGLKMSQLRIHFRIQSSVMKS